MIPKSSAYFKVRDKEEARKVIDGLTRDKRYQEAYLVAEEFEDFERIIQLTEELNDKQRLYEYMKSFKDLPAFYFQWCFNKGQLEKLLDQPPTFWDQLKDFLMSYPNLAWVHDITMKNFYDARNTTSLLAKDQKNIDLKKLFLSISLLSGLASEKIKEPTDKEVVEDYQSLSLIYYQEKLPEGVIDTVSAAKPLTPEQLIEAVIGDHRNAEDISIDDFLYALSVFRDSTQIRTGSASEAHILYEKIWKKCIEADIKSWRNLADKKLSDVDLEPYLLETKFYKVGTTSRASEYLPMFIEKLLNTQQRNDQKILLRKTYDLIMRTKNNNLLYEN